MTETPSPESVKGGPRARPNTPWNAEAKRLLQGEMARHGVTYKALARLMSAGGKEESATALMTRINRGTFTLAFFLEAVMKMGTRSIDLTHIALAKERRESRKS